MKPVIRGGWVECSGVCEHNSGLSFGWCNYRGFGHEVVDGQLCAPFYAHAVRLQAEALARRLVCLDVDDDGKQHVRQIECEGCREKDEAIARVRDAVGEKCDNLCAMKGELLHGWLNGKA
ncbi:MAG: hypothetical protein GY851_09365 [bacterium]|nr:hypothetical protein [bacterium]